MFSFTVTQHSALAAGVVSLIGISSLLGTNPSYALGLTNGSFENGFNSWDRIGVTSIETATFGNDPTQGTYQALLSTDTSGSAVDFELDSFLGSPVGSLYSLGAVGGSALKTRFTATAGDVVSFDWNFLTNELTNPANTRNDFAFVTIGGLSKLADTNSTFVTSTTSFSAQTGFEPFAYNFTTPGTYTLGIGVVDAVDFDTTSALLVDNVKLTSSSVPVPAEVHPALGLLILGALSASSVLKRQQP